jgi:Flp pilus assembly protein TadG
MIPSHVVSRLTRATTPGLRLRAGHREPVRRREGGAVLVHVAVAMMGLLAFAALTIDLGMLWVARAQAQNAADAGALAGGVALAYVNPTDTDAARAAAVAIAQRHQVWGQTIAPASLQTAAGACPPGAPAIPGECVQVRVSRDTASGTPLPAFFSRLLGVNAANVHATASAKVMAGNATPCPRPLAMADRWNDRYDTTAPTDSAWLSDDTFDGFDANGTPTLPAGTADIYDPPTPGTPGTGVTLADLRGVRVVRTITDPSSGLNVPAGAMFGLDLERPGAEGEAQAVRYEMNIGSCRGLPLSIGETVPAFEPHRWFYTYRPLEALIAQDPAAVWDDGEQAVRNSAFNVSPRLITIAVFDPRVYSSQPHGPASTPSLVVRNLVGLFVERVDDLGFGIVITGVIVPTAGRFDPAAPTVADAAAFLRSVALVR